MIRIPFVPQGPYILEKYVRTLRPMYQYVYIHLGYSTVANKNWKKTALNILQVADSSLDAYCERVSSQYCKHIPNCVKN